MLRRFAVGALLVCLVVIGSYWEARSVRAQGPITTISLNDDGATVCEADACVQCVGDEKWAGLDPSDGFDLSVKPDSGIVASAAGVTASCPWK